MLRESRHVNACVKKMSPLDFADLSCRSDRYSSYEAGCDDAEILPRVVGDPRLTICAYTDAGLQDDGVLPPRHGKTFRMLCVRSQVLDQRYGYTTPSQTSQLTLGYTREL